MSWLTNLRLKFFPPKHKYRSGQLCLVIKVHPNGGSVYEKYLGKTVHLGEERVISNEGIVGAWWAIDPMTPAYSSKGHLLGVIGFLEEQLMPLDDPNINEELA